MKITFSFLLLTSLFYVVYFYPATLVHYFGLIGTMIITTLVVLFAGCLIAQKLFPEK